MPPRFKLRTSADTEGRVQQILAHLEETGVVLPINQVLANSPHTFRWYLNFAVALLERSPFPAADREAVIMHLAAVEKVPYEWSEHVGISRRAGVTDKQRAILEAGPISPEGRAAFTDSQLQAIEFCDELRDTKTLSDETMRRARERWGEVATLDLILSVGWWGGCLPLIVRGLGLDHTPNGEAPTLF